MGPVREIKKAVSGHGHGCGCLACLGEYNEKSPRGIDRILLWRIVAAVVLFAAAWIVNSSAETASILLACASILCAGYDRLIRMFAGSFRERRLDEELLMGLVVVAAVAIGRSLEAAAGMILLQSAALLSSCTAEIVRRRSAALAGEDALPALFSETAGSRAADFLQRFSRFYTPSILVIAVIISVAVPVFLHTSVREGIYRALVLLVIACPCALLTSITLTCLAGVGGAAEQGIAVRGTRAMDSLGRVSTVVFDQSVLQGEGYRVISVKSDRMDADMLLRIAAHACAYSDGVYAESIKAAYRDTIYIELIQSFTQEPGRGITVEVDGVSIILGTEEFVREHDVDPGIDAVSEPCAYLAIDGTYAGRILLGPAAGTGTNTALTALAWEKDRQVVMLSEEPASIAEKFARLVGVGQYYADCSADRKADTVRDLKERGKRSDALLFAGDPKTDPAAFAAADIGVSSLKAGEDGSDVLVTDSVPVSVVRMLETAKRTRTIVRQSLVGILVFKLLVLLLDMLGVCPLWLAVFADAGMALAASVCAMRALTPRETPLAKEELT